VISVTRSHGIERDNIILPAVRKDFWEFLISRHPIEEDYAPSTKNAFRWRSVPELRLVIVQFVSEHGVGVFVRGEKGASVDEVEHRLRPYAAKLKKALGADEFFFARNGATPAKFFFQKFKRFLGDPESEDYRFLRRDRLAKGLSQTELADALGLTFQQVEKYEKGTNRVGTPLRRATAEF
jgi:Helix-turn-helix